MNPPPLADGRHNYIQNLGCMQVHRQYIRFEVLWVLHVAAEVTVCRLTAYRSNANTEAGRAFR